MVLKYAFFIMLKQRFGICDTVSAIAWWQSIWKWSEHEHTPFASRYRCQVSI